MSLISGDKAPCDQCFDSPDFKNLTWRADDTCTLKILKTNGMLDAAVKHWSTKNGVRGQRRQSKTASKSSTTNAVTALGRNSWDWMFHKEDYMKLVSAGYMAADPNNRQEIFSDGDHISGNSLEPGEWSLENDNGTYKTGQDWTHTFDSGYLQPARTAGEPHRECVSGSPWPVAVLYRGINTVPEIDLVFLSQLGFGHADCRRNDVFLDKDITTSISLDEGETALLQQQCQRLNITSVYSHHKHMDNISSMRTFRDNGDLVHTNMGTDVFPSTNWTN
jgi:hypothetical protein